MVFYPLAALVSALCVGSATAVDGSHVDMLRQLQEFKTDVPIACYYDGSTCSNGGTVALTPPNNGVPLPTGPSMVAIFPHDDITSSTGTVEVEYYQAGCAVKLIDLQQGLFPSAAGPVMNIDSTTPNPVPFGVATPTLAAITVITYPLATLEALPPSVLTTTDGGAAGVTYDINFCIRLKLLSSTGGEVGYRELDLSVDFVKDDSDSVTFEANDNDDTDITNDIGLFDIDAVVCPLDTPSSTGVGLDVLLQGEAIAICLIPQRDPDGIGASVAVATTEIIIEEIRNFVMTTAFVDATTTTIAGTEQDIYVSSVIQPDTSVAAADGNACALGLGSQTAAPAVDATIHGCRFVTLLRSELYEQPATGDIEVTASGTATIVFNGQRRVLAFKVGDSAELETEAVEFAIQATGAVGEDQAEPGCDIFLIGFIVCPLLEILGRLMRGGMDFFNGLF